MKNENKTNLKYYVLYFNYCGFQLEQRSQFKRVIQVHHPAYKEQMTDGRYKNFAKGLKELHWRLRQWNVRVDFLDLDMWN